MIIKVCKGCDATKPLSEFYYYGGYYHGKCKTCEKTAHTEWARRNSDHIRTYLKTRYQSNPKVREVAIGCSRKYRQNPLNKEHIKQVKQKFATNYRKDPKNRILSNLRRRLLFVLHGQRKSNNTLKLIGCSQKHLIKHLESQFKDGMTWDNYGKWGWNVDHIIPCASFDLSIPSQQRKCFHYTNLQPLWWKDNYQKGTH